LIDTQRSRLDWYATNVDGLFAEDRSLGLSSIAAGLVEKGILNCKPLRLTTVLACQMSCLYCRFLAQMAARAPFSGFRVDQEPQWVMRVCQDYPQHSIHEYLSRTGLGAQR
jgi:uncharacterized Fe-S cluster-containing radical SAM superfamily enzyme